MNLIREITREKNKLKTTILLALDIITLFKMDIFK
jgi:hypothetical protein